MPQTVQEVYGLLLRSGLVPPDDARGLLARWQTDERDRSDEPQRFVAWLVSNRHLTDYQGALLARGFSEGFFLNEYKVLERLGRGRMAGVYKAEHRLGQVVAIKVLPPSKARDANLKSRFLREARLALQLNHPNVVRAFQVGECNGLHYLVMEHLEGETLADLFARRGKLAPSEAVRHIHQALLGLQHIHVLGLVHRDLKPSNLMLVYPEGVPADETVGGSVKVLDIGLGRQLMEEGPPGDETALTSEGVVLGTPDYMAPEQARDPRSVDIRSDIYSLGCVLYHALAGRPPFTDANLLNLMIRHATEEAQPLKELNAAVPDELQQIVSCMMAKDPASRYATPERAARELQVFLTDRADKPATLDSDPGMRAYLSWLESQIIHAELPAWLAEMDTITAPELRRVRAAAGELPRPAPPTRPSKTVRPAEDPASPSSPTEKTKVVRKLRSVPRLTDQLPAAAPPAKTPPVPIPALPVRKAEETKVDLVAAIPTPEAPPPPANRGPRIGRRDLLAVTVGVAVGALATLVGCLFALRGRGERGTNTPEKGGENRK
jgi:serine/threonine protein kinase